MTRVLAFALLVFTAGSASAFYFPGWPGASRPPAPVLVAVDPPGETPIITPPNPPENPPETPTSTPEPATLVMGAIGACAIIFRRKLHVLA